MDAKFHAKELDFIDGDDSQESSISLPRRIFFNDEEEHLVTNLDTEAGDLKYLWSYVLLDHKPSATSTARGGVSDPRRGRIPVKIAPWQDEIFLAEIPSTDIWRMLAAEVSTADRRHDQTTVAIEGKEFTISDLPFNGKPILKGKYNWLGSGIRGRTILSLEVAQIMAAGGKVAPSHALGTPFQSSEPGYETTNMPYVMALYVIPGNQPVIFHSQARWCFRICTKLLDLLEEAWDDDDAYECDEAEVPIKIRVDRLRNHVDSLTLIRNQIPNENVNVSLLGSLCIAHFQQNSDFKFEVELIIRGLKQIENWNTNVNSNCSFQNWTGFFSSAGARWLLLSLALTLVRNMSYHILPECFEALLSSKICYIA
jgi:hypothetical protein